MILIILLFLIIYVTLIKCFKSFIRIVIIQTEVVQNNLNIMIEGPRKPASRNYRKIKIVSSQVKKRFLNKANAKYKVIAELMGGCGLRVTEVIRLQIKHFNFLESYIDVLSLKKGKDDNGERIRKWRRVPMTEDLIDFLEDYWNELEDKTMEAYLFPPGHGSESKYLSRGQVWRYINGKTDGNAHPHMFRHTAATNIVRESKDLRISQKLLGHDSIFTTEKYIHVEDGELFQAMAAVERKPIYSRIYRRMFPKRRVILTPTDNGLTKYHVGRKMELKLLAELMDKKVNIYIQADQGMGKTHLLDNITGEKILRIDEFSGKQTLGSLLIELFEGDKRNIAQMLFNGQVDFESQDLEAIEDLSSTDTKEMIEGALNLERKDLTKVVMKNSVKRLVELAIKVTKKDEYTIIIDDVTRITPSGVKMLEHLKNHFHIICAARNIKIDKGTFLTNFQKIELKPLGREETIKLINLASKPLYSRIEDYEAFKNHIWEHTGGNPLYVIEMIDRYSKEANISLEVTKDIRHTAALQEINMALPIIIMISGLMVLRYYGREAGDDSGAFMLFGGVFMIFALFARPLANLGKRKWI